MRIVNGIASVLLACSVVIQPAKAEEKKPKVFKSPVRVFVMAGQSNIGGYAGNPLLEYQANAPETKAFFAHLRDGDKWVVRDDVFVKFGDRRGPLTIGYGAPGYTGIEYEFLTVQNAQWALNSVPEFKGNVKAFRTDVFVDKPAEALFPKWRDNQEEWKKIGSQSIGYSSEPLTHFAHPGK